MTDTDVLSQLKAKSASPGRAAELLTAHLAHTLKAALLLQQRVGRVEAAEQVLGGLFWPTAQLAALTHDGGKIPDGFQQMVGGLIRSWGERHEVLSLGFLPTLVPDPMVRLWTATAVATHHRALTAETGGRDLETLYGGMPPEEFHVHFSPAPHDAAPALYAWLHQAATRKSLPVTTTPQDLTTDRLLEDAHQLLEDVLAHWADPVDPEWGLAAVLLQGAVTLADHLSSAHGTLFLHQPLDTTVRSRLEKQLADNSAALRPHQRQAADTSGHMLLRAPTGSGKTEAALLWAARQVADLTGIAGGVPRVFYTLPYLSSINAMATRLGTTLDEPQAVGVAHSRAASYHLAAAIAPEDEDSSDQRGDDTPCRASAAKKAVSRAAATKLFRESIRVGTPYQILRAALAGPAHSSILIDATNSVFILDELHAYDAGRLGYILASARLWEHLGGRIAVLSATLPHALAELFRASLHDETHLVQAHDPDLPPRHRLHTRDHRLTEPAALDEIRRRLARDDSVLVVANNVAHALQLFDELAPTIWERHGPDAALLLHSRYKRGDRSAIEKRITSRFGTRAARKPGLLVATQVVEVSLDVDFDALYTAAAPLEALFQRFGRVNRIAARPPADVIVHHPTWTLRHGDAHADGIYPAEPVEAALDILAHHQGRTADEARLTDWLNEIYDQTPWGSRWHAEVQAAIDTFQRSFLDFPYPFDDRSALAESFDQLFDGTEAVLVEDREAYAAALAQAPGAAGRLLADEYLIPMPHWAGHLTSYERQLKVRIIDGDYQPQRGLLAVRGIPQQVYQPGEVL